MQRQGYAGAKTAYQRWKESGQPRPYLREVVAVERFDFFSLASLLLAIALLVWWFHSIYRVAFPESRKVAVVYSRGGDSFFARTPVPALAPGAGHRAQSFQGGTRTGGTLPGGTRTGGNPVGLYLLLAGGAMMALAGFLGVYAVLKAYPGGSSAG
jgi:hypothetical protein